MMNRSRGMGGERGARRTHLAILVGFALLIVAGLSAIATFLGAVQSEAWASHTLDVRLAQSSLLRAVTEAQAYQSAYNLTRDSNDLRSFAQADQRVPTLQLRLRALTRDNGDQQAHLSRLDAVVDARMSLLRRAIELDLQGRPNDATALLKANRDRGLKADVEVLAAAVDTRERRLMSQREDRARFERAISVGTIVLAVVIAGALAVAVIRAEGARTAELEHQNQRLREEIDRREEVQAQLQQAQKMEAVGQLTGGIAHDFNNMLAIIVGNLDLLLRRLRGVDDRLAALAENAMTGANRAAALTKRLLAFSRLQPLDPQPTDINTCMAEMAEMLRRVLGEAVQVEAVLGGGVWRAMVDRPQLESAILNLAVNARDAMPEGGRLTLETRNAALDQGYADENVEVVAGQYVLIAIADTGHGMAPSVIERAFDPFFTTKPVGSGTGLGLSQVHGFIKQSRGHIRIWSQPGVGTTIKLYLPRDTSLATPRPTATAPLGQPVDERFTVLIAEDDDEVRAFASEALRSLGFDVIETDNAAAALEKLDQRPDVAVLLTDVVMPVMDGRRLAEAALRQRPDLRVVYMTGYARDALVHDGVLDAQPRLITKPFTVAQLDREMRAVFADLI